MTVKPISAERMREKDGESLLICYLNQDFLPEVGAGPARLNEMSRQWQANGASVVIVAGVPTRRIPDRHESEGTPEAYRGRWAVLEDWDGLRAIRSWVFTGGGAGVLGKTLDGLSFAISSYVAARRHAPVPDVVLASSPPFFPHVTGVALARHFRVPLVLEIRDLWPDYLVEMGMLKSSLLRRMLFALERWLLARADHVVVVTESFRTRIIAKGVPPQRVSVIPNGVDLKRYISVPMDTAPMPGALHPDGVKVIGYLGTLGRGQQITQVVRAAARLRDAHPKLRFEIVGDGPERQQIAQAIVDLNVGDMVNLRAPISRDMTPAFYGSCDVVLVPLAPIPIFQETVPSKIFEVMASGRPFIASLSGEGARIVNASGGGVCVPPGDDAALAGAILDTLAMSQGERRVLCMSARDWVAANFDRQVLANRYYELFSRLLNITSSHASDPPITA